MKAVRVHEFGPPEVMVLEDVTEPRPAEGQVLVRIHAIGVNPVETYVRSGAYAMKPTLPYTPGTDAAGTVEAVGASVTRFKPGDRVYATETVSGAYAEKALCDEAGIHTLPENVSFAQGAALGVPYCAAYRALFQRAQALPGETVLIHGASGGVGIAAVQLARAAGLIVIGTAGTEESRQLVAAQGAHHVLDHRSADYLDQVMKLTDGRGVNIVVEMVANVNLGKDLGILAAKGRVVVVGSRGTVEINPRDAMIREASILGMLLWSATPEEKRAAHAAIGAGLANGTVRPAIGKTLPLKDAAQAHHDVIESRAFGKIVLQP